MSVSNMFFVVYVYVSSRRITAFYRSHRFISRHEVHIADLCLDDNKLEDISMRDIAEYVVSTEQPMRVL